MAKVIKIGDRYVVVETVRKRTPWGYDSHDRFIAGCKTKKEAVERWKAYELRKAQEMIANGLPKETLLTKTILQLTKFFKRINRVLHRRRTD